MAIVTYPLNNVEFVAEDVEQYFATRKSGVYAENDNFDIISTSGMSVTIGTGLAWIRNGKFSGKSVRSDSVQSISLDASSASLSRIDRIVLRFSVPNNRTEFAVVKGMPASSPVAPNVTQTESLFELGLYAVTVRAGSSEITTSDILDTRADESVCGIMKNELDAPVTLADLGGVPTSRKINAKALSADVVLSAPDVEATFGFNGNGKTAAELLSFGNQDYPFCFTLAYNNELSPDANACTCVAQRGMIYAFSYSGKVFYCTRQTNGKLNWNPLVDASTTDLTAGSSSLANNCYYNVYE